MGRGILLWMLGVPLPIILLLAMCSASLRGTTVETTLGSRVLGPRVDDSRALADVDPYFHRTDRAVVPGNSAASWAAIIAGAFVAVSSCR